MNDRVDTGMAAGETGHRRRIGDVDLVELEPCPALQLRQPGLLQRDIVIRVQIVDADDPLAAVEQVLRDMKPDKPGAASNQAQHSCHPKRIRLLSPDAPGGGSA